MTRHAATHKARAPFTVLVGLIVATTFAPALPASGRERGPSGCSPPDRRELLAVEQAKVLDRVGQLATLRDEADLARLGQPDPRSGTAYNVLPHQFVSLEGMGVGVLNTGDVTSGYPDLLLYEPAPGADVVTDPHGPDFPYILRGWGYLRDYEPRQHPEVLGPCIVRDDWFVHERSIHPSEDWTNHAVPPHEDAHGQVAANDPPLAIDCDPLCPTGLPHGRFWDIHLWLGPDGVADVSMLNPGERIPGAAIEVGTDFFYPETPHEGPPFVPPGHIAHHENCHYATELFLVAMSEVADRVPDRYRIRSDDGQSVLFAVQEFDCESVAAGEATGRVRGAQVGVEICAPELAETQCQEDKRFDFYTLYFGTDSGPYSEWLRAGTDFDVTYEPDLVFDYERRDPGLAPFFFRSTSPPKPWAFEVSGAVAMQSTFSDTPCRGGPSRELVAGHEEPGRQAVAGSTRIPEPRRFLCAGRRKRHLRGGQRASGDPRHHRREACSVSLQRDQDPGAKEDRCA